MKTNFQKGYVVLRIIAVIVVLVIGGLYVVWQMNRVSNGTIVDYAPSVTVLSPNGGEIWKMRESKSITWKQSGFPAQNTQSSSVNSGQGPNDVITVFISSKPSETDPSRLFIGEVNSNSTSYNWTVGSVQTGSTSIPAGTYYVQVCRKTFVCDWSDTPFTITN